MGKEGMPAKENWFELMYDELRGIDDAQVVQICDAVEDALIEYFAKQGISEMPIVQMNQRAGRLTIRTQNKLDLKTLKDIVAPHIPKR